MVEAEAMHQVALAHPRPIDVPLLEFAVGFEPHRRPVGGVMAQCRLA